MPARYLPLLAFLIPGLKAQTCLSLSTAAIAPGGTAILELALDPSSGTPPAALQWTFQYPSSGLVSLNVENGPAATAAGKTVMCNGSATAYTCLVVGANANTIPNGVVAKVTVVPAPDVTSTVIVIGNLFGASAAGDFIPVLSERGAVTRANVSPDRGLHPPLRRIAGIQCRSTR
jgi:hypothetical protein